MAGSGDYTAEQLSYKAGVPLRTVRFYVAEKLIDPPLGRGRGAHFTDHHLVQLQQARVLQNAGFSLDAIRERQGELSLGLKAMEHYESQRLAWAKAARAAAEPEAAEPEEPVELEGFMRIPMAEGVDLLVDENRRLPSPKQLVDIALYIRKVFGDR